MNMLLLPCPTWSVHELALIAAEKEELVRQLGLAKEESELARTNDAGLVAEGDRGAAEAAEAPDMAEEPTHGNWVD